MRVVVTCHRNANATVERRAPEASKLTPVGVPESGKGMALKFLHPGTKPRSKAGNNYGTLVRSFAQLGR